MIGVAGTKLRSLRAAVAEFGGLSLHAPRLPGGWLPDRPLTGGQGAAGTLPVFFELTGRRCRWFCKEAAWGWSLPRVAAHRRGRVAPSSSPCTPVAAGPLP